MSNTSCAYGAGKGKLNAFIETGLREALDNLDELASRTKNYSGAEIEGLIRDATSYAFYRCVH